MSKMIAVPKEVLEKIKEKMESVERKIENLENLTKTK